MQLPGGLYQQNQRKRDHRFKPVTGALEFELAEIVEQDYCLPQMVTLVLLASLDTLGQQKPTQTDIESLCIADRQFLMRQLQWHLGDRQSWFTANCHECEQNFDFQLDIHALPVNEGNDEHPFVTVILDVGPVQFRLPNGADQCALIDVDEAEARTVIIQNCLTAPVDSENFVAELSEQQIEAIENAMEQASPGIVTDVQATCAYCEAVNTVYLDPYQVLNRGYGDLLQDIHCIASAYHWSEQQILALSNPRRAQYLRMIEAEK